MFPLTLHVFYNECKTCALVICIPFVNKKSVILGKIKVSISGPSTSRYVKIFFLKNQAVKKCEGEKKTPLNRHPDKISKLLTTLLSTLSKELFYFGSDDSFTDTKASF